MFFKNLNRGLSCAFVASVLAMPVAGAAEVLTLTFSQRVQAAAKNNFVISDLIEKLSNDGAYLDLFTIARWVNDNKSLLTADAVSHVDRLLNAGFATHDLAQIKNCIIRSIRVLAATEGNQNVENKWATGIGPGSLSTDNKDRRNYLNNSGSFCRKGNTISEKNKRYKRFGK